MYAILVDGLLIFLVAAVAGLLFLASVLFVVIEAGFEAVARVSGRLVQSLTHLKSQPQSEPGRVHTQA